MARPADTQRVLTARFRIELPEDSWIAEVSRSFPEATFRLLAGFRTERGSMQLGEIRADDPVPAGKALESHPSVATYQRLHTAADRSLARYETTEAGLYEFLDRTALVPDYPVVVKAGWFEVDFTETQSRFDEFRAGLEASALSYELLSVVETVDSEGLLTDRQHELLERALQQGYFEVPRECTLTEVAETVGVDKSTASGILRRAQARLVKRHLSGPPE